MNRALFIVFEGIDGAGTSTQSALLTRFFEKHDIPVVSTREPGGTALAERVRTLVLDPAVEEVDEAAELLLYGASRAQHVKELIEPSLKQGKTVISDRYTDSSLAYQGYGRGLPIAWVEQVNAIATRGVEPDLTFVLDLPLAEASERMRDRVPDRLEQAGDQLQRKVRQGYLDLAAKAQEKTLVLDGTQSVESLADRIAGELLKRWPDIINGARD